jgi:outer membrane autotransporter protein
VVGRLTPNIYFDARAAWGRSENDTSPLGTYIDTFDTDRWLTQANLTGVWNYGPWRISPTVGVTYYNDEQEAYVDSNGVAIAGQEVSLGRVNFGPEIGYRFTAADGSTIEPLVAIEGLWDFDKDGAVQVNGTTVSTNDVRAKIKAGINVIGASGYAIKMTGVYDGIGDDEFESYGGQLWIDMPLN